jgi:hypothetical protein
MFVSCSTSRRFLLRALLWFLAVRTVFPSKPRSQRREGLNIVDMAVPWLLLPALVLILISVVHPTFAEHYVFFSTPAFALLVGHQLALFNRRADRGRRRHGSAGLSPLGGRSDAVEQERARGEQNGGSLAGFDHRRSLTHWMTIGRASSIVRSRS